MTILEKVDLLRKAPVLGQVRTESLARLAALAREMQHGDNEILYVENQAASTMYLLLEGVVSQVQGGKEVGRQGSGALLGCFASLAESTYRETAVAAGPARSLAIHFQDLLETMALDGHVVRGIIRGLATLANNSH